MSDNKLCCNCKIYPRLLRQGYCQSCRNKKQREWNLSNTGLRWQRYRLTKEDIYAMWLSQGGRCAICPKTLDLNLENGFHVDHDNNCCPRKKSRAIKTCGQCVRGLLCGSCNRGLGYFQDNPLILDSASSYLKRV